MDLIHQRLTVQEGIIERGLSTFLEVGAALLVIRQERLYKASHTTFEDYCRERWAMSRQRAHQLLSASEVVRNVSTVVDSVPVNERQARELARLPEEAQPIVWAALHDGSEAAQITSESVRSAVDAAKAALSGGVSVSELGEVLGEVVQRPHVAHNSGNNEWYTPDVILDAARETMGAIDLDPASSVAANARVQATAYYTAEDDGLTRPWFGRVWLNPPYAQPLIDQFVSRVCDDYLLGKITCACVLVNNATDTAWGQKLLGACSQVCFLRGRVRFLDPEGVPSGAPLQGQMVAYLGRNDWALERGIGARGSSFTDLDGVTHDGATGRFLIREFKERHEPLSRAQRTTLACLAGLPGCTVWFLRRLGDQRIGWAQFGSGLPIEVITESEYQERVAEWWRGR